MKNILKIVIVFIFGIGGGIFADQILWPYFIERPLFYQYRLEQAPIYLTEKHETIIQENIALQEAVERVEKSIVGVRTRTRAGRFLEGSGIVLTSDGLIITLATLLPKGESFAFFVDGKTPNYQVLKRDLKNNLALVKLEETNLPTVGFADFGRLRLGERVFLVGFLFGKESHFKSVNEGIIKFFTSENIGTNIFEKNILAGSPLFNIRGELLGLNTIDSEGKVIAILVPIIREFIGF